MRKEKQIEEMAKITAKAIEEMVCKKCEDCKWNGSGSKDADCTDYVCAEALYNAGYRKQSEWISVKDRMPEEKLKKVTYASQDIATGEIVESEERMSYVSEIVAVLDYRHMGEGEFELVPDYDKTYNGQWGYNMCVKYWMPLPEIPTMKGGEQQ